MKSFLSVVFVVAIAWTFAGCGPEKVRGSAPNVVGLWEWSNPAGGSWRLTISPDGSFRREMTDSAKAKPAVVHGSWSIFEPRAKEQSWLQRHRLFQKSPEDELTRKAGFDPAKNKIEWSAPALLSLHYTTTAPARPTPAGATPGPAATGGTATPEPKDSKATPPQEMVIGETEAIRTFTDKDTGDVFLELAGKTYKKVEGAAATAEEPKPATSQPEASAKATSVPSTPSATPATPATTTPAANIPAPQASPTPVPPSKSSASITPIQATHGSATPTPAKPRHGTPASETPIRATRGSTTQAPAGSTPPAAAAVPVTTSPLLAMDSASPWDASVGWWMALSARESAHSIPAGTESPKKPSLFPAFTSPEQARVVAESSDALRAAGLVPALPVRPGRPASETAVPRKD
jgi:hypothetical protein